MSTLAHILLQVYGEKKSLVTLWVQTILSLEPDSSSEITELSQGLRQVKVLNGCHVWAS